jgi:hypothetical protein
MQLPTGSGVAMLAGLCSTRIFRRKKKCEPWEISLDTVSRITQPTFTRFQVRYGRIARARGGILAVFALGREQCVIGFRGAQVAPRILSARVLLIHIAVVERPEKGSFAFATRRCRED